MRRRGAGYLASSPTMVGAITILIAIVAVFLAYNANTGLPFVPTYDLNARLPNASALVRGNEVRIGGVRVGRISSVTAVPQDDGSAEANVAMTLDQEVEPLPADSTMVVRPRGPLALKYLEITPGDSEQPLGSGDNIPARLARPTPVELDDLFNTFDEPTRKGVQGNLRGFGDALAARGPDLNAAFGALRPLLESAQPATANLADRRTRFGDFWAALTATAAEVVPVATTQAELFGGLDRTFSALAEVSRPYIQETISRSPATLDEGTRSLPAMRPFLRHSAQFFTALGPGAKSLAETSPDLAAALQAGAPVLRASPKLIRQLEPSAQALLAFQEADGVRRGLDQLIDANEILDPALRFITPAQADCHYLSTLFHNAGAIGSTGDDQGLGTWQRFVGFGSPIGPNSEGSPASAPASGPDPANHLHYNPYPFTASPGQADACEAGRERFGYVPNETQIGNAVGGG